MPERKTLNEDLFYKGSSANLPRLNTCKNKVPFWDFKEFYLKNKKKRAKIETKTKKNEQKYQNNKIAPNN